MTSAKKETEEQEMSMEVQCVFKSNLPEEYQIPAVQINMNTSSTPKELTQVRDYGLYIGLDCQVIDRRRRESDS